MKDYKELIQKANSLSQEERNKLLLDAIRAKNFIAIELSIILGADVTADDNYPIRWASKNGYTNMVKIFIKAGADVTACNNQSIRWASANGFFDTVKLLAEAGADIAMALPLAATYGRINIVQFAIDSGVDVTACNNYAIRAARVNGHTDTVNLLGEHGAALKS